MPRFARVARFELSDADGFTRHIETMRRQTAAVQAATESSMRDFDDEAAADLASIPEALRRTIKELTVLVDREGREAVVVVVADSEDDIRNVDEALSALPVAGRTARRTNVRIYEVALDDAVRPPLRIGGFD
jgi:hypothetical protein